MRIALHNRGATLLELMLYLGVVSVILIAATLFAGEFVLSQAKAAARFETTRNAKLVAARIAAEVREATDINTGASVFDVHPGTLSLETASAGTDPTVFTVTDGVLTIQQGVGAAIPLTSSSVEVADFVVDDVSVGARTKAVRISITTRYVNPSGLIAFAAESTIQTTVKINKNDGFGN